MGGQWSGGLYGLGSQWSGGGGCTGWGVSGRVLINEGLSGPGELREPSDRGTEGGGGLYGLRLVIAPFVEEMGMGFVRGVRERYGGLTGMVEGRLGGG